jgi:hypothetical protein
MASAPVNLLRVVLWSASHRLVLAILVAIMYHNVSTVNLMYATQDQVVAAVGDNIDGLAAACGTFALLMITIMLPILITRDDHCVDASIACGIAESLFFFVNMARISAWGHTVCQLITFGAIVTDGLLFAYMLDKIFCTPNHVKGAE